MQTVDLRLDAGFIVPIEPAHTLANHALLIDAGRIVAVVSQEDAQRAYVPREHVDLPRHVLVPGLVNAHSHAAMSLFRGIADDVPLALWLERHIWPREANFVAPDFVYDGVRLAAVEMLAGGITCCNDMYFFPESGAQAFVETGMRAMLGLPVLDFPTPYAADPDGYLQAGLAVRDACKHEPRLTFALAPHAPYTVGDATFEKIVMYARQLDLPIQTHLAETALEVFAEPRAAWRDSARAAASARRDGPGLHRDPRRAPRRGRPRPSRHPRRARRALPDVEHETRQRHRAGGCARRAAASTSRSAPTAPRRTTGWTSSREMRLASLLAKVTSGDAAAFPAHDALHAATLGGARALGLDRTMGSLLPGKEADIVAVDLSGVDAVPCYDPVSHLVHAVGRDAVTDVWVGGKRVVAGRALTTVDEAAIVARARLWQERMQ